MQTKWEREESLHMTVPEEVMTELRKRIDNLEQAVHETVDLLQEAKERVSFGEYDECTPVSMNPYQDRLRHTQNNNWRGNGKRGKRKWK